MTFMLKVGQVLQAKPFFRRDQACLVDGHRNILNTVLSCELASGEDCNGHNSFSNVVVLLYEQAWFRKYVYSLGK